MRLAIIEDEQVHKELLLEYLGAWSEERQVPVSICCFSNAENFLFQWEDDSDYAVLFVDIQMGSMDGMQMVRKVRETDAGIPVVFTTGISDYISEGYEVEAMHYLLKPLDKAKVFLCMDKVWSRKKTDDYLLVHTREEIHKLSAEQINYIEAQGHGCVVEIVKRESGKETERLEITESISEMEKLLAGKGVVRCHRSYLCQIKNIHHIEKTELFFDSGSHIPISRRLYAEVNQTFIAYFRKL
ncbi:MAG: response regulator transcription factor [Lachnospiraceae bacterium]|nr:response regulator transcription factor [Lachnospiraceae bacterium]